MPSSSAALFGTHWSVLDNHNRKLGTVAEYAVPATRYQQLSRFAPLLMQVDVMGHLSLCRESLGETGKSSSAHAICDAISHNYRASRTANGTGYRLASAAYQRKASRPRNRKLARQYGIESPHDTTFSDTVALRRRVF